MPTYQYRCTSCAADVEVVQKFTDDPLTDCPDCDGNLRKVFNAVGVVFKGSGFYATDNRSKGKANAASSEKSTEKSASSAASDAKPTSTSTSDSSTKSASSTGTSSAA